MGGALDDCRLRFVQKYRRPPQNTPAFGGPTDFPVGPQIGGILGGAPVLLHKSESIFIENTPHISQNRKGLSSIASDVEEELFY